LSRHRGSPDPDELFPKGKSRVRDWREGAKAPAWGGEFLDHALGEKGYKGVSAKGKSQA